MVMGELNQETELLVIGGGPGGYAAAFRAADLGLDVTLVDMGRQPGGVCLFRGCIPSKTFLHVAEVINDARRSAAMGVTFGEPRIDLASLREWKQSVVDQLAGGLTRLSDRRSVQWVRGRAVFEGSDRVRVHGEGISHIRFHHAILATGSHPVPLHRIPFQKGGAVMNSTGALALADVPHRLLIVGGGYVGLELGTIYAALGSRITLVEKGARLLPGVDADLVDPLEKRLHDTFREIYFNTGVADIDTAEKGVLVSFEGGIDPLKQHFDRVLVAIGRHPNTQDLGLETTRVRLDEKGFVLVDEFQRTTDPKIYAVGDVAGGLLLAHKATREGKVAAEVIAGEPSAFDARVIPAIVYTDPQIAWCGLTQEQARKEGIPVTVQRFPWKFSGRAMSMGAPQGFTKLLIDPETRRILGVGITGRDTEGLISEGVLAIEMGALAEDMALTIHPHPTLSETEAEAAEIFLGSATHILPKQG